MDEVNTLITDRTGYDFAAIRDAVLIRLDS